MTLEFLKETFLSSRLGKCDQIVNFEGVLLQPPTLFLVYEFCDGGTLEDRLESNRSFPFDERVWILLDTANGLRYLHRHNFLHRDVKAGNVLLKHDAQMGRVLGKLCDFGTTRELKSMRHATMSRNTTMGSWGPSSQVGSPDVQSLTTAVGTLACMPPEIWRTIDINDAIKTVSFPVDKTLYGFSLDVWCYGYLMWHVAMRRQMFNRMELVEIKDHILQKQHFPLHPRIPEMYRELQDDCMSYDPGDRPRIEAVIGMLTDFIQSEYTYADSTTRDRMTSGDTVRTPASSQSRNVAGANRPLMPARNISVDTTKTYDTLESQRADKIFKSWRMPKKKGSGWSRKSAPQTTKLSRKAFSDHSSDTDTEMTNVYCTT